MGIYSVVPNGSTGGYTGLEGRGLWGWANRASRPKIGNFGISAKKKGSKKGRSKKVRDEALGR